MRDEAPTSAPAPAATAPPTSTPVPPTPVPVIVVTAKQLLDDYDANEIAASQKYKGQMLEITGVITSITDVLGTVAVSLTDGSEFALESVRCKFDRDDVDQVATLTKGDTVTLRGIGDGYGLLSADVKDCKVVTTAP